MDKQYVVRIDRRDGKYPEVALGPAPLWDCVCYVQGWWGGFKVEEVILCPEVPLFRIYIVEVEA